MDDFHVLGGASNLLEADALVAYSGSQESSAVCEVRTALVYPMEQAGDVVFRRLYVPVEWEAGIAITITPIVDGEELVAFQKTFVRSGADREEFAVPMNKRGTRMAVLITTTSPTGPFAVDTSAWVLAHPALPGKSLAVSR